MWLAGCRLVKALMPRTGVGLEGAEHLSQEPPVESKQMGKRNFFRYIKFFYDICIFNSHI